MTDIAAVALEEFEETRLICSLEAAVRDIRAGGNADDDVAVVVLRRASDKCGGASSADGTLVGVVLIDNVLDWKRPLGARTYPSLAACDWAWLPFALVSKFWAAAVAPNSPNERMLARMARMTVPSYREGLHDATEYRASNGRTPVARNALQTI